MDYVGFKSMLETFVPRTPFKYNIPSLDKLLASKEIPDSFLMYDEQVLSILISAGINAADAYVCLKGIKKKKFDKVEAFKEVFKEGYAKHLMQDEGATKKKQRRLLPMCGESSKPARPISSTLHIVFAWAVTACM